MLRHTRTLGIVQVDESVWKKLTAGEKAEMERVCDQKLMDYFERACREQPCQTPHILDEALSWHSRLEKTGSMRIK